MIAGQLTDLAGLLARLAASHDATTKADKLRTPRRELEKTQEALTRLTQRARLFIGRTILESVQAPAAGKALDQLAKVRERLNEDNGKLTEGTSYQTLKKRLDECVEFLENTTKEAWRVWLSERTAPLDAGELARVQATAPALVAEVLHLQKQAVGLPIPNTEAEFANNETVVNQLREAIDKLQPYLTTDPEVQAFLDAVNRGGAALALLTPAVTQYLTDNRLTGQFRIVRGEPVAVRGGRR